MPKGSCQEVWAKFDGYSDDNDWEITRQGRVALLPGGEQKRSSTQK